MKKVTISAIKADVGSIGGHTKPTKAMMAAVTKMVQDQIGNLLIDGMVTNTGDDIALLMSHIKGEGNTEIHQFAWQCFLKATELAQKSGCYGAGQDLLIDAPSGNVRGAGPGVAEIEFVRNPDNPDRKAEAFMIVAGDKCAPGAYNLPLYLVFCDPMHNGGILLNPVLHEGFTFDIIDMDYKADEERGEEVGDRIISLDVPERIWDVAALLQNPDRFAVEAIHSRHNPFEKIVSVSATRLHNVAGKYTGKDDPIMVVRTQGMFPAPEEITEPMTIAPFVTGDARGSHIMAHMPVPINTAVTGPYCLPILSALAFSMDEEGKFTSEYVDVFDNVVWDGVRRLAFEKSMLMRAQGFVGASMASVTEIAYTGLVDTRDALEPEFRIRPEN